MQINMTNTHILAADSFYNKTADAAVTAVLQQHVTQQPGNCFFLKTGIYYGTQFFV